MNAPWDRLPLVIGDAGAEMLRRFRTAVEDAFPGRLRAMVLFGSRARGNGGPDSNWDVALFIEDLERDREGRRLNLLAAPFHAEGFPVSASSRSPANGPVLDAGIRARNRNPPTSLKDFALHPPNCLPTAAASGGGHPDGG